MPNVERAHKRARSVPERWQELMGSNNWDGLLYPLDHDLRGELLRYGDLAQVTEDAFPWDEKSRYPYACPYPKADMFREVELPSAGYEVQRYLYAYFKGGTTTITQYNWIGYVAVADDAKTAELGRRDILVAWRGTRATLEWYQDTLIEPIPITSINDKPVNADMLVSQGFWSAFADSDPINPIFGKGSAGQQATQEVKSLVEKYQNEPTSITCIGHSLGGTLATFCAYQIAEDEYNKTASGTVPVTAITFASPRVGNDVFQQHFDALGVKHLRIKIKQDIAPIFPFAVDVILNMKYFLYTDPAFLFNPPVNMFGDFMLKLEAYVDNDEKYPYVPVGTPLSLDYTKSLYLIQPVLGKTPENLSIAEAIISYHNLQAYLHLLDGTDGGDGFNVLALTRDLALINKNADLLSEAGFDHMKRRAAAKWWRPLKNTGLEYKDGVWQYPYLFDPTSPSDPNYD